MTRARTTLWAGVGALAAAGVLGMVALSVAGSSASGTDLSAPPASASVVPSTIGPDGSPSPTAATLGPVATSAPAAGPSITLHTPPTGPRTPPTGPRLPASTTTTTTTTMLSPLSSLVGETMSVVPAPVVEMPVPARLVIAALGVDVPVRAVGLEADGQLEIPDETEVGWYRLGSSPGEPGASVMAGHVSWNDTTGPFFRLAQLEPGATIDIARADGTTRTYEVVERAQYPKLELPTERIWTTSGPEVLVLVTCGGDFNPDIRRYRDNIVVYAVPVA